MPSISRPPARTVVIWAAFLLAACGWLGTAWSWLDHGHAAGVNPGFLVAMSVGITGTLAFAVTFVLPDSQRIYALGYQDGMSCSTCPLREADRATTVAEVRHLTPVR